MAHMQKWTFEKEYVQVPNETAKAPEIKNNDNPISLEALGLLVNLWSYNLERWELHKTELYHRFAFNKERAVKSAWNDLMAAGYIIEFKWRNGRKWEYEYIFNIVPYTEEQKEMILAQMRDKYGEISGLQNEDPKNKTSKRGLQKPDIRNIVLKKDELKKDKLKKEKPLNIDDDEKEPFEINIFAFKEFKQEFEKNFENYFDEDFYSRIIEHMTEKKMDFITYAEAVEQLRYMNEQREKGLIVADSAKYFVGGIELRRTSRHSAINKEKVRKAEKELKERKEKQERERDNERVPLYNWLEN